MNFLKKLFGCKCNENCANSSDCCKKQEAPVAKEEVKEEAPAQEVQQ